MIPFVDLKAQYVGIKDEVNAAVQGIFGNLPIYAGEPKWVNIRTLDAWTEGRRSAAAHYDRLLSGSGVPTPEVRNPLSDSSASIASLCGPRLH